MIVGGMLLGAAVCLFVIAWGVHSRPHGSPMPPRMSVMGLLVVAGLAWVLLMNAASATFYFAPTDRAGILRDGRVEIQTKRGRVIIWLKNPAQLLDDSSLASK